MILRSLGSSRRLIFRFFLIESTRIIQNGLIYDFIVFSYLTTNQNVKLKQSRQLPPRWKKIRASLRYFPLRSLGGFDYFPQQVTHSLRCPKGLVNFYGNTRLGNLKRDHRLFLHFRHTGPPIILNVEHGVTVYFDIGFKRGQRLI